MLLFSPDGLLCWVLTWPHPCRSEYQKEIYPLEMPTLLSQCSHTLVVSGQISSRDLWTSQYNPSAQISCLREGSYYLILKTNMTNPAIAPLWWFPWPSIQNTILSDTSNTGEPTPAGKCIPINTVNTFLKESQSSKDSLLTHMAAWWVELCIFFPVICFFKCECVTTCSWILP